MERYDAPSRISRAIHPRLVCVIMYINLIVVFTILPLPSRIFVIKMKLYMAIKNMQVYNLLATFSCSGTQYIQSNYMLYC